MTGSGPFRALLWKEWRDQRMIFGVMMVLEMSIIAAVCLVWPSAGSHWAATQIVVVSWCLLSVLLGANTFTGEAGSGRDPFAEGLPVSRDARFWIKMLVSVALLASCMAATYGAALCIPKGRALAWSLSPLSRFLCPGVFLPLAAIVSPACRTPLMTAALAGVLGLLMCVGAAIAEVNYYQIALVGTESHQRYVLGIAAVTGALLLLTGWWVWAHSRFAKVDRRRVRSALTCVGAGVVLVVIVLLAVGFAQALFLSMEKAWLRGASADGRYMLLQRGNERTMLLDTLTSKRSRVTHLRSSHVSSRPWSPSGARFLVTIGEAWPTPDNALTRFLPAAGRTTAMVWVVDAATGARTPIPESRRENHGFIAAWYDDNTVAFPDSLSPIRRAALFKDLRTGAIRRCAYPPGVKSGAWMLEGPVDRSGIWEESAPGTVLCFKPEWSIARRVDLDPIPQRSVIYHNVSPDGRWLLGNSYVDNDDEHVIWSLDTGRRVQRNVPAMQTVLPNGQRKYLWRACGYTSGGKGLLFSSSMGVGLYAPAEERFTLLYAHPAGEPQRSYLARPVTGTDQVLTIMYAGQPARLSEVWALGLTTGARDVIWRQGEKGITASYATVFGNTLWLFSGDEATYRVWLLDPTGKLLRTLDLK